MEEQDFRDEIRAIQLLCHVIPRLFACRFFEKSSLTARRSLNNDQKHGLQTSEPKRSCPKIPSRINELSWTGNLHKGKQQRPTSFSKVKHKCYLFMTPTNKHTHTHTFPTPGSPSLCPLPREPGCRAPES